jgi:hypothetical protein
MDLLDHGESLHQVIEQPAKAGQARATAAGTTGFGRGQF